VLKNFSEKIIVVKFSYCQKSPNIRLSRPYHFPISWPSSVTFRILHWNNQSFSTLQQLPSYLDDCLLGCYVEQPGHLFTQLVEILKNWGEILRHKICLRQKMHFYAKKRFYPKKVLYAQKHFYPKKLFLRQKCFTPKMFYAKNVLRQKTILTPKSFFTAKNILGQLIVGIVSQLTVQ